MTPIDQGATKRPTYTSKGGHCKKGPSVRQHASRGMMDFFKRTEPCFFSIFFFKGVFLNIFCCLIFSGWRKEEFFLGEVLFDRDGGNGFC